MGRVAVAEKPLRKWATVRSGRPRRELAGEVDERILDAARRAFIKRGLAGASIDEIAAMARAGKPTIYARFPNKVALFTAVVMRNVATVTGSFAGHVAAGTTVEERLTNLGATLLEWALAGDTVDLMRVGISEANRFPDLANSVHGMARRCGEDTVGRLLSDVAQSDGLGTLPAFAPERLATTTQFFLDAGAVRRKAQSVAGRDRAPCRPQRRFLSRRLSARRRELSLAP